MLLLCTQGLASASGTAVPLLSDQVSELLRQQLEPWKTPPPAAAPVAPPELVGPPAPADLAGGIPAGRTTDVPQTGPAAAAESPPVNPARALPRLTAGKEPLRATAMLLRFYEGRSYRPAWSDDTGPLPCADALVRTIRTEAEREGLRPEDYPLAKLTSLLQDVRRQLGEELPLDPRAAADLDLLLTDTFLTYGARVAVGKAKLDRMDAAWFEKRQKPDLVELLETAVEGDRVADTLVTLPPQHPGYARLREVLARYRDLAAHGGWPLVAAGPKLQPGDHDERVPALRARLRVTGELVPKPPNEGKRRGAPARSQKAPDGGESDKEMFDATVAQAVRRFQRRHGLSPDGVVGDGTVAALNVSAEDRVQQIAVNMDRWRALPADLGRRHIDVNVPNFSLEAVENEQPVIRMKVVVGKMMERRNTPTFSADMTYLVLNPYWFVPKSIAEEELFPLSRKDPQYLAKHNFTVRRVPVADKRATDPNALDGALAPAKTYQYLLRQKPGPTNSLGQLKFMLPNAHGVYLHDTPAKELFHKTVRTFSHGCIRIEKPVDLAEYVLHGSSEWTRDAILSAIERQKQQTIWLPEPIPVYIQYWTAWVDQEGTVQFRNDIYGYDQVPGTRLPIPEPKILRAQAGPEPQPTPQPEPPRITQPDHQPVSLPEVRPML